MLPPPQPALPAPTPQLGMPGVVRLHIDSPLPARVIEQRSILVGRQGAYGVVLQQFSPVCISPCDRIIDGSLGQFYTLSPEEFPAPKPFSFAGMTGDVTLHVEPGSLGRRTGGLWMTIFGSGLLGGGLVLLPFALLRNEAAGLGTGSGTGLTVASITMLSGGAALLIGGIAMLASSGTKVRLEPRAPTGRTAKSTPRYWLGEF